MELILSAIPNGGKLTFSDHYTLEKFCTKYEGIEQSVTIEPIFNKSEKLKMYRYYHKVMLPLAVIGYTNTGEDKMDNVRADYMLRAELCKDFGFNHKTGVYTPFVIDKRDMSKDRLRKFLVDAVLFIEKDLGIEEVPDSAEYKENKLSGKNFKSVRNIKE